MSGIIPGYSNKIHVPEPLNIQSHTDLPGIRWSNATQRKNVVLQTLHAFKETILRLIGYQWSDQETQNRILAQKGKLLNAIKEIKQVIVEEPHSSDAPAFKAQLDKIARRVDEIRFWELNGSGEARACPATLDALEKALIGDTKMASQTYKAGENLKSWISKGWDISNKDDQTSSFREAFKRSLSPENKKELNAILKTNFVNIEDLEKAFTTVERLFANYAKSTQTQKFAGYNQFEQSLKAIRTSFEAQLPNALKMALHPSSKGEPTAQQLEEKKIACMILNRHDLDNNQKEQLFSCAHQILDLKHHQVLDVGGNETTLYDSLWEKNRETVDRIMKKIENGEIVPSFEFKDNLSTIQTIYENTTPPFAISEYIKKGKKPLEKDAALKLAHALARHPHLNHEEKDAIFNQLINFNKYLSTKVNDSTKTTYYDLLKKDQTLGYVGVLNRILNEIYKGNPNLGNMGIALKAANLQNVIESFKEEITTQLTQLEEPQEINTMEAASTPPPKTKTVYSSGIPKYLHEDKKVMTTPFKLLQSLGKSISQRSDLTENEKKELFTSAKTLIEFMSFHKDTAKVFFTKQESLNQALQNRFLEICHAITTENKSIGIPQIEAHTNQLRAIFERLETASPIGSNGTGTDRNLDDDAIMITNQDKQNDLDALLDQALEDFIKAQNSRKE